MVDELLTWFRDEVVTPIVRSLLTPNELDSIVVAIAPRPDLPVGIPRSLLPPEEFMGPQVWVEVNAWQGTEQYRSNVLSEQNLHDIDMVESRAYQLAGDLEDWVCETRFAWGQQRVAQVPDITAPPTDPAH